MIPSELSAKLGTRIAGIRAWLARAHPDVTETQKHLDEGTSERAYWHLGYLSALQDVLKLIGRPANRT